MAVNSTVVPKQSYTSTLRKRAPFFPTVAAAVSNAVGVPAKFTNAPSFPTKGVLSRLGNGLFGPKRPLTL